MNTTNMRVIIADDSDLIRERLEHLLSNYSRANLIGSVDKEKEALDAIKVTNAYFAILQNKMRGLSGLKMVKEILNQ